MPESAERTKSTATSFERSGAPAPGRQRGRPRDAPLDAAILAAAEHELEEKGYAGMSMESVAAIAGTTSRLCAAGVPTRWIS